MAFFSTIRSNKNALAGGAAAVITAGVAAVSLVEVSSTLLSLEVESHELLTK